MASFLETHTARFPSGKDGPLNEVGNTIAGGERENSRRGQAGLATAKQPNPYFT